LATTSVDSCIKLWNTNNWTLDKVLDGHKDWVWDCCYSSDSTYLLSGGSDKTALLWEIEVGIAVKRYAAHNNTISAVALTDSVDNEAELIAKSGKVETVQQVTKTGRVIKRAAPTGPATDPVEVKPPSPKKSDRTKIDLDVVQIDQDLIRQFGVIKNL